MKGTPGKVTPTPGKVAGTPGKMKGIPGKMKGIPGKMEGTPGKVQGTPGKFPGIPGKMEGIPGKSNQLNQIKTQESLLAIVALTSPQNKHPLTAEQSRKLISAVKELGNAYNDIRSSTKIFHETLTPDQFEWLEKNPDNSHADTSNVPPEQGAYEPALAAKKSLGTN